MSPGILLSSGYIAGGAIAGIAIALLSLSPKIGEALDFSKKFPWAESDMMSLVAFAGLTLFLVLVGAEKILKERKH